MREKKLRFGLMPESYCQDDKEWINEKLSRYSTEQRAAVCKAYSKVYRETYEQTLCEIKRENTARKAANLRLIKYIAKH